MSILLVNGFPVHKTMQGNRQIIDIFRIIFSLLKFLIAKNCK